MGPPHSPRRKQARDGPTPVRPLHIPGLWSNQQRHCHAEHSRLGTPSGMSCEGPHHHDVQDSSWSCWHRTTSYRHLQPEGPATPSSAYHTTLAYQRGFFPDGTRLWNALPNEVTEAESIDTLRNGSPSFASNVEIAPAPCKYLLKLCTCTCSLELSTHSATHTHSTRYPRRVLYYTGRKKENPFPAHADGGGGPMEGFSRHSSSSLLARLQAKLVLGQAAANVKIRGRILFAVRGCETILFSTWWYKTSLQTY